MSLAALFLGHLPEDRRPGFAAVPDLDGILTGLATAAHDAWPALPVETDSFVLFLARCLPPESASELAALRSGDLYLVCAYGLGFAGAVTVIEERYMSRVAAALARIGTPPAVAADIGQDLRRQLIEMLAPDPRRKGYAGRGDLAGWLRVCAVREAGRRRGRGAKEQSLEAAETALLASAADDPEMALLRSTHTAELRHAFGDALASLSSRDRNVLRYHLVDGLSIDHIGTLYSIHRATAARWIERAKASLSERTREHLCQRMSVSNEGFQRMLALIESQVGSQLAAAAAQ